MMTQSQFSRSVTVLLSLAIVTVAGLVVVMGTGLAPNLRSSETRLNASGAASDTMLDPATYSRHPIALTAKPVPPLLSGGMPSNATGPATGSATAESMAARFDDIVVEVNRDGSLRVLGEPMQVDGFKSLLSDQLREQLRTMVTIRPDTECLFRHVGRVISACDEAGVPHRMQSRTTSANVRSAATSETLAATLACR